MKQDLLTRFTFDNYHLRGELVQLQQSYQSILEQRSYPVSVQKLLGELLSATSLLTATLKFEGDITVQLQGDGPLNFVAISGNHRQELRGIARWEGEQVQDLPFAELVGKGHIVITITPEKGERYQGIVELDSAGVAKSLENYFAQSEQLPTRLWLHTGQVGGQFHCAGLFLQALPGDDEKNEENFSHVSQLNETMTANELFTLDAEQVLFRLYHQEDVRTYEPQNVQFKCTCSQERCESALLTMDLQELRDICEERGEIAMHCDYCGHNYRFNAADVENIFSNQTATKQDQVH